LIKNILVILQVLKEMKKNTIRDYTIKYICNNLMNGDNAELCRLQLVNEMNISAIKIQDLAAKFGPTNDIVDFNLSAEIDINNYAALKTAMTNTSGSEYGLINNPNFVLAAFMAIAQSTSRLVGPSGSQTLEAYASGNSTTTPPSTDGNAAAASGDVITSRDLDLVDNIRAALEGGSSEQIFEFFYMMAKRTRASGDNSIYKALCASIMNQLAEQMAEDPRNNSAHHLPSGWSSHKHDKITKPEDRRLILSVAIEEFFKLSDVLVSTETSGVGTLYTKDGNPTRLGNETNVEQADINAIETLDSSSKSKIIKVDKLIQRLAKLIEPKYTLNELVNELGLVGNGTSGSPASGSLLDLGKLFVLYVTAYKYESAATAYKLYDVPGVSCAGLGQASVQAAIETGYISKADLQEVMHAVKVVSSVNGSYTNSATTAEAHTFVAIDPSDGNIVTCTGFSPEGEPVYGDPLTVEYTPTNSQVPGSLNN